MICSIVSALAAAAKRPNILFLFADEMDGRIFDATSPQLKPPMPHLTRLAARGALFQRVYNQSPQCVPSRSALMVGLRRAAGGDAGRAEDAKELPWLPRAAAQRAEPGRARA